jgi:DNA replication and repair protein RecF
LLHRRIDPDAAAAPAERSTTITGSIVAELTVTEFRNYERATVTADGRPVVLTGPNGAGKTNLLEAISLLVPGRGLRHARLSDIDRRMAATGAALNRPAAWGVAARVASAAGETEIGTGRDPADAPAGSERRLVKINGALAGGPSALSAYLAMVWLTPQMDRLFLDGASARRRFVDRLVAGYDPEHTGRLAKYNHALQERTQLLARSGPAGDAPWLDALETQIAEHGIAVAAARMELASRLGSTMAADDGPFPGAELALEGAVEAWLGELPALAAEDRFRAHLAESRRRDADSGRTQFGPHRSDLGVRDVARRMPAELCSTGEQKALLISIVLAHARLLAETHDNAPILLLDEVAAHLDALRRRALFDAILALGLQAWLTGTDEESFAGLRGRARFLRVRDAAVQVAWP